jgi:hypothetical protein
MQIETTTEINASADAVWHVFGERFEDISHWADGVVKSRLDGPVGQGAVRTCDIKQVGPIPAGQVTEELTVFEREARELTYVVRSGVPPMMESIVNAWTIEPLGPNRCRITSVATFHLKWWARPASVFLRFPMRRALRDFAGELRSHVEAAPRAADAPALARAV